MTYFAGWKGHTRYNHKIDKWKDQDAATTKLTKT